MLSLSAVAPRAITLEEYDRSCEVPIDEVMPKLFLGNAYGAGRLLGKTVTKEQKLQALTDRGITHILCCTNPSEQHFPDAFTYEFIAIDDDSSVSLEPYIDKACAFIKAGMEQGGVLVHCSAGSSRSASMIIAFLMRQHSLSYEQALGFLQSKRPCVQPNQGFEKQLKKTLIRP